MRHRSLCLTEPTQLCTVLSSKTGSDRACNPSLCVFKLTIPAHVDSATEELTLDLSDPW